MTPLAATALLLATPPSPAPAIRVQMTQLTIRREVIVRVPARAPQSGVTWRDRKGPRCTTMDQLAGAVVTARDSVDLILRDGSRLRAEFASSCPSLSFYSGFYILPTADRRICADRDSVHDRSGGDCAIERFRTLVPDVARRSPLTAAAQKVRAVVQRVRGRKPQSP